MAERAARPRKVNSSDQLDTLLRLRRNFAVQPLAVGSDKWNPRMRAHELLHSEEHTEEEKEKRLIRDMSKGVHGVEFPAEELAKIIRGWMNQDD